LSASKRRYKKGHPVVDCIYGDQKEEQEKTHESGESSEQETGAQEESAEKGTCAKNRVEKESGATKKDPRETRSRIFAGI